MIGLPHETYGEVPAAVVRELPFPDEEGDVRKRMVEHVSKTLGESIALEGGVMQLSELGLEDWPYNSSNKIQKRDLVEKAVAMQKL